MTRLHPRFSLKALQSSTSGSVFIEFAVVAPMLVSLLVSSLELTRWMRARQHMEDYAAMVASDISGVTTDVTASTLREQIERIGLVAPELVDPTRTAWGSSTTSPYLAVGISMVNVTSSSQLSPGGSPAQTTPGPCTSHCGYTGALIWSFGNLQRSCSGVFSLPNGLLTDGPVVIVDVKSVYRFVFDVLGRLGTAPTLSTTTFQAVRNWQQTSSTKVAPMVSPTQSGIWTVTTCP